VSRIDASEQAGTRMTCSASSRRCLLSTRLPYLLSRAFQSSHLILPGERTPTRAARQSPVAHRECTDSPADAGA
jgi:hypothetical protein